MSQADFVSVVPGDPASCSALGGELRRQAGRLHERRMALRREASGLATGWTGPAADAFSDRLRAQLTAVEQIAGRLDEAGAALQAYATDLAHARSQGAEAVAAAHEQDLAVGADGLVKPRPGPVTVETAERRLRAVPMAQHQVDLAHAEGRAAVDRLRRRTHDAVIALRSDVGRLAALDQPGR